MTRPDPLAAQEARAEVMKIAERFATMKSKPGWTLLEHRIAAAIMEDRKQRAAQEARESRGQTVEPVGWAQSWWQDEMRRFDNIRVYAARRTESAVPVYVGAPPASPDRVAELEEALREAQLQITYLHEKFGETGSGNAMLTKIIAALSSTRSKTDG